VISTISALGRRPVWSCSISRNTSPRISSACVCLRFAAQRFQLAQLSLV
jgi:hypothetical protein